MTLNQQLTAFAQAVGQDYKALKALIEQRQTQNAPSAEVANQIQQAITALKNELMGGELDAQLDTLKELGDALNALQNDEGLTGTIITKFSDISQKLTALEQQVRDQQTQLNELTNSDLATIYQQAKGA